MMLGQSFTSININEQSTFHFFQMKIRGYLVGCL